MTNNRKRYAVSVLTGTRYDVTVTGAKNADEARGAAGDVVNGDKAPRGVRVHMRPHDKGECDTVSEVRQSRVYARWDYAAGEDLPAPSDLLISCGVKDDQREGYYHDADGARVEYITHAGGVRVTLSAPSLGLEEEPGYWLSPDNQSADGREAVDFGTREEWPSHSWTVPPEVAPARGPK